MTDFEFDQGMQRLMQVFPSKGSYSEERLRLIFKTVRNLPAYNFNRIVDHFIATARYAPLPKDFLEAAIKERAHLGHSDREWTPPPPIECEWCNDGGLMEIEGKQTRKEYFVRCGCEAGRLSFRHELPRWAKDEMGQHFTPHKMFGERALKWRPKSFDPKDPEGSLTDQVELWRLQIDLSKAFWREWYGQPEETA